MVRINVGRLINGKDAENKPYSFVLPDMIKVLNASVHPGDHFIIPVNIRDGVATLWELGGRNASVVSSIGTIIAGAGDRLMNAILFNKLGKTPNSKQALMGLKNGYHLYVGKISFGYNELAPSIRILKLTFNGIDNDATDELTSYGDFTIDSIFTEYGQFVDCLPAKRLVEKLFACNVMKPYYANGWSLSDICSNVNNRKAITDNYERLMNIETTHRNGDIANQLLDDIENSIIAMKNPHLSSIIQYINFETGKMAIKPLSKVSLSDIAGTIEHAVITETFNIDIKSMMQCYNSSIMFHSSDIPMLEVALAHDEKYAIKVGSREYVILRGWRG